VPSLDALCTDPLFTVDQVITQPDRPFGRKQLLTAPPVKVAALRRGLPVLQPESINRDTSLKSKQFDFLVVVSFGQILSQTILDLPRIAPVNVHASLLPRWRGASPLQHAILNGDTESGVTVQIMERALDAGPILAAERTPIEPRETTTTLHDRLARMGAELLRQTLSKVLQPIPQSPDGITLCGKLTREDGRVDTHTMTAEEIDRKVRALTPWPGVSTTIDGQEVKLVETALTPEAEAVPYLCKDKTMLYLRAIKPAGRNLMSGTAWMRGRK